MKKKTIFTPEPAARFEKIKSVDKFGREFWAARELQIALDYSTWEHFEATINNAIAACRNFGVEVNEHFKDAGKDGYFLSRYACSLISLTGDSTKKVMAEAQLYFAIRPYQSEKERELLPKIEKQVLILSQHCKELLAENRELKSQNNEDVGFPTSVQSKKQKVSGLSKSGFFIKFSKDYANLVGGNAIAAIMLSYLVEWQEGRENAWLDRTEQSWANLLGFTTNQIVTARKYLSESGFVEIERRGMPARMFYRVDLNSIRDRLPEF